MGEYQSELITFFLNLLPSSVHRKCLETRVSTNAEHTRHPFWYLSTIPPKETRLQGGVFGSKPEVMKEYGCKTCTVTLKMSRPVVCTEWSHLESPKAGWPHHPCCRCDHRRGAQQPSGQKRSTGIEPLGAREADPEYGIRHGHLLRVWRKDSFLKKQQWQELYSRLGQTKEATPK